jgi:hypothetical protein
MTAGAPGRYRWPTMGSGSVPGMVRTFHSSEKNVMKETANALAATAPMT